MSAQENYVALPLRAHTILGVCEAIGEDFGFNPLWLRLAFIAPVFFAPMAAFAVYLGLGVIIAASRWLTRDKKTAEAPQLVSANAIEVENNDLAIAA